jgi:hypothetical protein
VTIAAQDPHQPVQTRDAAWRIVHGTAVVVVVDLDDHRPGPAARH